MVSSRARRGGVERGTVPGSPWATSPFFGLLGWSVFFATIAIVIVAVVAIASPRTAAHLAVDRRWGVLLRVVIALWLLPLAWWAWTIATTGRRV